MYNISVLVDQRFGHGTWQTIITERAKRIEAAKAAEKERIKVKKQQQEEFMELAAMFFIGLIVVGSAFGAAYVLWTFL